MKTILITLLKGYHFVLSPLIHQLVGAKQLCRYETSCSSYAINSIKTNGVVRGCLMATNRFFHCNVATNPYAHL